MTYMYTASSGGMGSVISGTTHGSLIQGQIIKNKCVLETDKGDFQVYSSGEDLTKLVMNNYIKERMPVDKKSKLHFNK